ncbi:hypothetical protein FisN_40Hh021 [Fistulifera solaris]|uniref:Lipoamide acyltransferase component of branched-chain alpha-keto acid dehydrogenase complex, mitochondrial n=1 Tax=Fistulifera solaris TaxID=1519565 RepID=A0A1Z5K6P9_FISSO|nr:hypothetical protein FisN_40Hh021 [Fistulifera solaris]|eukprot:GAX21930.1 hypothetical protein FisN_40Hh021 [Fistulifera solaris]
MHRCLPLLQTVARPLRRTISTTPPRFDKRSIKVPSMGDSITEGTIVEWTAQVGQAVQADDVVALVETDKVTVEIKSEISGVITKQFGAIDETVEVGANLYEIDTDASASVSTEDIPKVESKATNESSTPVAPSASALPLKAPTAKPTSRTPSIHFLGKEGWATRLSGGSKPSPTPQLVYIPPTYGRPKFTQEEIDALITGGADLAPSVLDYSSGAKFRSF